jgi:hypothetical protein
MRVAPLLVFIFAAGCSRSYVVKEYDQGKSPGIVEFLATLKTDDEVTLVMKDGSENSGTYYSTQDGYVTIQQGQFFRDYPLADVRMVRYKSESRNVKPAIYVLAGVMVAVIIFEFSQE